MSEPGADGAAPDGAGWDGAGRDEPRLTGVRRLLTITAVVATLVGLPAVLIGGALLRHVGHVAPSVTNVVELRQRVLGHDIDCDDPKPDPPLNELDDAATALSCRTGDGTMRLAAFTSPAARKHSPVPWTGWVVEGANWRILTPDPTLAHRLARALTGRARYYRV